jgi:hypothetical protein
MNEASDNSSHHKKSLYPHPIPRNLLLIGITAFVLIMTLLLISRQVQKDPPININTSATPTIAAPTTYENTDLGVTFRYPSSFKMTETTQETNSRHTVFLDSGQKRIAFDRVISDGTVPEYARADQTLEVNGIMWNVLTTDKDDVVCDAGNCGRVTPSYSFFQNGFQYSFYYYADDLQPVVEDILHSFRITTVQAEAPKNQPAPLCADYRRGTEQVNACATCGNAVCEPYETCTSSGSNGEIGTTDCGPLYCPLDCEQN